MIVLKDVPLLEIEHKTINNHVYTTDCCKQIIKDMIHKKITGTIHFTGDEPNNDNQCLEIENPYVKIINNDDEDVIMLFCCVNIDEDIVDKNILEKLKTNPFRIYPCGSGVLDENGFVSDYELFNVNIEIEKNI